ncbi:MAG TPA: hypothetical protein VNW04_06070 [Puia sp.]|jgi:hypothetical protein|nr:hypothetical protein [Puia sp.]
MKYLIALCLAGAALLSACSNHKQPAPTQRDSLAGGDPAKNSFFPVADYLEAEILQVDSSLLAFKKFTIRDGHTDSSFIQIPEFNTLALEFVPRELADSSFEKNFTESAFQDKATRSIIFSYSPTTPNMELQRVDVVTVAGLRAQQVKSVYLEKSRIAGDSVILKKLFWKAKQSFEIATITRVKGKQTGEEQIRVIWAEEPEDQ